MTTATLPRPRLRQVFPDGGHLDLAPAPGDPAPVPTRDEHTAARLALALLLARHGPGRDDGRYQCSHEALDGRGTRLAGQDDPAVKALAAALRGTDLGETAQRAALQTAGLAAG